MACESCARFCPAGAVPKGEPSDQRPSSIYNNAGFRKWWINAEKCLIFWGINKRKWPSCGGRCIAVCPWIKPMNAFHNPVRWLAIHAPGFVKRFLVRLDEITQQRKKTISPQSPASGNSLGFDCLDRVENQGADNQHHPERL
jgi:hypothetical protein